MVIKEFTYGGSKRIVAVNEETATNIKGFDLGKIADPEELEVARKLCESININEATKKLDDEDYAKAKHLMSHYRNFIKSKIS